MVELEAEGTGLTFEDLQKSFNSLVEMVMDHCLALNFFLAEDEGVCAVAKISCYTMLIHQ
jgi:hypothetical protein